MGKVRRALLLAFELLLIIFAAGHLGSTGAIKIIRSRPGRGWKLASPHFTFGWSRFYFNQGIVCSDTSKRLFYTGTHTLYRVTPNENLDILASNTDALDGGKSLSKFHHIGDACLWRERAIVVPLERKPETAGFAMFDADTLKPIFSQDNSLQIHASFSACRDNYIYSTEFKNVSVVREYEFVENTDEFAQSSIEFRREISFVGVETLENVQGGTFYEDGSLFLSLGATGDSYQYVFSVNVSTGEVREELKLEMPSEMEGITFCKKLSGMPGALHFQTGFSFTPIIRIVCIWVGSAIVALYFTIKVFNKKMRERMMGTRAPLYSLTPKDSVQVSCDNQANADTSAEPAVALPRNIKITKIALICIVILLCLGLGVLLSGPVHYTIHIGDYSYTPPSPSRPSY